MLRLARKLVETAHQGCKVGAEVGIGVGVAIQKSESEWIRSPESEPESESEQPHNDYALLLRT